MTATFAISHSEETVTIGTGNLRPTECRSRRRRVPILNETMEEMYTLESYGGSG